MELGESCFQDSGLKENILPKNLKNIGQDAFKDCKYLEKIVFEEGSELNEIA